MKTHQQIDERSLALARAVVEKIDRDPQHAGLDTARAVCQRWYKKDPLPVLEEWMEILSRPWEEVRAVLLDQSENARRLRQSTPFCGILTPQERWDIYREFSENETPRT